MNQEQCNKITIEVAPAVHCEPEPSVTVRCSDEHQVLHLKHLPKDLRPLAQLVANPHTKESVWMNACVAAGDKPLVAKNSWLSRAGSVLHTFSGASAALLVLMFNIMTATLFSSYAAFLINGVDPNIFMRGLIESHMTGVIVAIGSGFAFWYSLLIQQRHLRRFLVSASVTTTTLFVLLTGFDYLGPVAALLVSALAGGLTLFVSAIAGWCREGLPKTFNAACMAKSTLAMLFIPALINGLMLMTVFSGEYHSSPSFSTPTVESAIFAAGILFYTVFGQCLALSVASRTSSRAATALLSTCVQAPLLLGLGFTALASLVRAFISSVEGFNGNCYFTIMAPPANSWFHYGPDKALFTVVAIALTLSFTLGGSYLGAAINARRSKIKDLNAS
jgi:hypothetical protein